MIVAAHANGFECECCPWLFEARIISRYGSLFKINVFLISFFAKIKLMRTEEVVDLIREELNRQRLSRARAAREAGLPVSAFRYVLEGREPRLGRLIEICDALGLKLTVELKRGDSSSTKAKDPPLAWVASLRDEIIQRETALQEALKDQQGVLNELLSRLPPREDELADDGALAQPVMAVGDDNVPGARPVEVRELAAAAGGGSEVDTETVTGSLWFRHDWLERHGLEPKQCCIIGVTGESMEPTLEDGCSILVNRAQRRRRVGHLFVVRTEEGLIAKRAGKDDDDNWVLVSEHPSWPPVPWPKDAPVIGEVRWTATTLP